jgi:adenylate cyclase
MTDGHPQELMARLTDAGYAPSELDRATRDGRLLALAVDSALGGGPAELSLTAVAKGSKLPTGFVRELMLALGRPNPRPGERAFGQEDLELAGLVKRLLDFGLPRQELLEVLRVQSQGMSQTAEAVRRLVGNAMLEPGTSERELALRYIAAADQLRPVTAELLRLQFGAHLRAGIGREVVTGSERAAGRLRDSQDMAVAFADLVDYTTLGGHLPPEDMGRIAGRLAELAVAAVRPPVTLVKTIGDAAMFVSSDVDSIVEVVEKLTRRIVDEGPDFPAVRTGIAFGPATTRGGDWFGATVNLASRVCDLAKPGQILATEEVRRRATGVNWSRRRRRRRVKGIDERLQLYAIAPAS